MKLTADIVVCGGSFSAPAAALQAARTNPQATVLLIESGDWLGGQTTSQGVAAIDNAWHNPGATLMRENPARYYAKDYLELIDRVKKAPAAAPGMGYGGDGVCWVSREGFDPRTAAWVLDQMIAEQPNIKLMKLAVVKEVATTGPEDARIITGLTIIERQPRPGYRPHDDLLSQEWNDWYSREDSHRYTKAIHSVEPRDPAAGMVVIDATEVGDVMVLSGADYTVGREQTTERFAEDGTPPAIDENGSQAFVFVFCMSTDEVADAEDELKAAWPGLEPYYAEQCQSFYSLGNFTFAKVWTYRRLYTTGKPFDFDSVSLGDVTMQNWNPGNDYPYGTLFKSRADLGDELGDWRGGVRLDQIAAAELHAIGFYFYMKDRRTTAFDTRLARGDMRENMMDTPHGLAKFPYVRCGRRLVGLDNFRITSREFTDTRGTGYAGGSSFRYFDSVGIGSYASDVHATKISQGMNPHPEQPAPFYIPYRSLASRNVRNLLASGKNIAATYVTNSAYRLHPIEWAAGTAAGAAAAIMHRDGLRNDQLLELPRLRALQEQFAGISPIHWEALDATSVPPTNGDLIVNDLKPIQQGLPFLIEAFYPHAAKAEAVCGDAILGSATARTNGAFAIKATGLSTGTHRIEVRLYNETSQIIDTATAEVSVVESLANAIVVDNFDPGFAFAGDWKLGIDIPDRYGLDYRSHPGSGEADSATAAGSWRVDLPKDGVYLVEVWYPAAPHHTKAAPFTVIHHGGETEVHIDQTKRGGSWVPLGNFKFAAGDTVRVMLTNKGVSTDQVVVADAVRATLLKEVKV
ncbi:FAD-dependent oxidoreductase [bacterium]|nr:FAD-dependent oxidoreductase [bacterium]